MALQEFLIIKPSSFGDIIHGLLVAESIRRQLPEARVHWVARRMFVPIVKASQSVNGEVFIYKRSKGVRGIFEVMGKLRKARFDVVLDMQGLARSALMCGAAKAPIKIGRKDAREFSSWVYNRQIEMPRSGEGRHAVAILREFLPALGLQPIIPEKLSFTLPETESGGVDTSRSVLIFPDSRRAEKEWPYFAKLSEIILQEYPDTFVHWMGTGNFNPGRKLSEHPHFEDLRGKTPLEHLPGLVSSVTSVICNDSGPMHLAAAVGVPTLGIFGPTLPALYGPWPVGSSRNKVICAPDGKLSQLRPSSVFEAFEKLMANFSG